MKSTPKTDENYGTESCANPDLSDEFFEMEKQNVLQKLEENCLNRLFIEYETAVK